MSDLIDRQAAQTELMMKCERYTLAREESDGIVVHVEWSSDLISVADAMDAIRDLPSAQPDGIPLEWIDKHLEWLDNCDNDFAQLAKVGIRAMVEIWKKDKT